MALVKVNHSIVISYISQAAKPAGGFRLYYNPTPGAVTVTVDQPSVSLGVTGQQNVITDDITAHTVTANLARLLPLIEIPDGDPTADFYVAIAPVDANGNVGDLSLPVALELTQPTFDEVYTFTESPVTLGAENLSATGSFANATGWTQGAEWVIGTGVATFTGAGTNTTLSGTLTAPCVVGETWRVQFEVISVTGAPNFYVWAAAPESRKVNVSTTGVKTVDITITNTAFAALDFTCLNTGNVLVIDNVSFKKIT